MKPPTGRELALHAARLILDKQGLDVAVYALPPGRHEFSYAVLATGRSDRQVHALVDDVLHFCKQRGIAHYPLEGSSGWQLLDCHDVVVHAMSEEMHGFYRLARLWPAATTVDLDAELAKLAVLPPVGRSAAD
jgi:ribosome-associated protein